MTTIRITHGSTTHAADVLALLHESFAEYRGWLKPESGVFSETVVTLAAKIETGYLLLATAEGTLIGCVLCQPQDGMLYFGRLAIHPAYRQQGVAKRLIRTVEQLARAEGYLQTTCAARIMLPNNVRFFQSLGYIISAEKTHARFNHPTFYQFVKTLRD